MAAVRGFGGGLALRLGIRGIGMKALLTAGITAAVCLASATTTATAAETSAVIGGGLRDGVRVSLPLQSFKARRDADVVKQSYDYSCGAGALATLLTYALGDPVGEREILRQVLAAISGDDMEIRRKEGLSLLDLQRVAEVRGFRAQGFRLEPRYLSQLKSPVIVFIKPLGYEHFAVLRGVRGDRVLLADPSRGNVRVSFDRFLDMWLDESGRGVIFVVEPADGSAGRGTLAFLTGDRQPRPELLSAREMLEVGSIYDVVPALAR